MTFSLGSINLLEQLKKLTDLLPRSQIYHKRTQEQPDGRECRVGNGERAQSFLFSWSTLLSASPQRFTNREAL